MLDAKELSQRDVILDVSDLSVRFQTRQGAVQAVNHVTFQLRKGEILGLVGESGCGKSVTVNALMGLIGKKKHEKVSGQALFDGRDLVAMSDKEMRSLRGNKISMVFQDPMTTLNPLMKVGWQVAEPQVIHHQATEKHAAAHAVDMLSNVGIPNPKHRAEQYPFEFSGGMRQRAIIAMSLMCRPEILIADEPTTALDVTIQAQILDLLGQLRDEYQTSILLITHDLGVVAETCDTVAVMYASEIVEMAPVAELFASPRHPYTQGLLRCLPVLGKRTRLEPIPGQPPVLINPGPACKFMPRCPYSCERCQQQPPLFHISPNHTVQCWREEANHG